VVAPNFSSSSESMKFFSIVHQVTPSVSSFSNYLELLSDFGHISISSSDVIPLTVSDIRPPREFVYLFVLSLGVLPSEFVALYLPEMHDETHITICSVDYKFAANPHSILGFVVKNVMIVTIHSERFPLRTLRQLHARHTCFLRV